MRARIEAIEISNFKSFLGKNYITPTQWNAVIAPNGSGKSSLIDAITFALGETDYSRLRIYDSSELIPRTVPPNPNLTSVRLTITSDKDPTVFYRGLSRRGGLLYESLYAVNGKIVSAADYLDRLKTYGINIKARDFVVYQGNINGIVEASPLDRSNMLEIASGSIELKERHDNFTREIATIHQKVVSVSAERRKLKGEIDKYNKALERVAKSETHQRQFNQLLRQSYLLQLKINHLQNENLGPDVPPVNEPTSIDDAKQESRHAEKIIKKISEIEDQLQRKIHNRDELTAKLLEKNTLDSNYQKEIDKLEKWLKEEEKLQSTITDINEQIRENEKLFEEFSQKQREHDEQNLLHEEHEKEYYHLQSFIQQQKAVKLAANESTIHTDFTTELNHWIKKYENLEKSIKDHQTYITDNRESLKRNESSLEVIKAEIEKLHNEKEEKSKLLLSEEQVKDLEKRKREIDEQLEIHDVSSFNRQFIRRQEGILDKLEAQFPERVYGRISQLCRSSDNRYKIAIAAALDKGLNAIVVEDDKTAMDCLKHLQNEKMGFETIYSIRGVTPPPLDRGISSKLGNLDAKLVYDILRFDKQFEPVIKDIVKSTILCQTLEDAWKAMDMMQNLNRKHNIVTMTGEILTTRFTVSAGFNERKMQSERIQTVNQHVLEEEREGIIEKLRGYRDGSLVREIQKIESQIGLNSRCKNNLSKSIGEIREKIDEFQKELRKLEGLLKAAEEKKKDMEVQRDEFNLRKQHIQQEIDQLRMSIFQDFCGKLGINEIGEFEEKLRDRNKLIEERQKAEAHLQNLKFLLESEESRSRAVDVEKWRRACDDLESKRNDLKEDLKILNEEKDKVDSSVKKLEEILEKEKKLLDGIEVKRRDIVNVEHRNRRKSARASRLREELEKKRKDIVSAAKLDSIVLPEIVDYSGSCQSSGNDNQKKYDFSYLETEWQRSKDINYLKSELVALEETLEMTRMKIDEYEISETDAVEKLETLKKESREVETKLEDLRKREREIREELKEVKRMRLEAFTSFFDKASGVIDDIYKQMNNNDSAYALLIPEDPEEPYLKGIRYDCTPPGKRFRSVDELSGGEKAMAGLTFLFALQETRSPSLVILDEVDGALDPVFVGGFVNYLKKLKDKHQIFMISHNHRITAAADTAILVTPDISSGKLRSIPITIDLAGKFNNRHQQS